MNKATLDSLKELVKTLNDANAEFGKSYSLEPAAFQRGHYHVEISTDSVIFSDDLCAIMKWASEKKVLCWARARHSYVILDLQ